MKEVKIQQDLEQDLKGWLDLDQRWGEKGTWAVGGSRIPGEMGRCRAGGRETGAGGGGPGPVGTEAPWALGLQVRLAGALLR